MTTQLQQFQSNLTQFAHKHRREINKNPVFRQQFHEMCTAIGVDPLQSTKGFWTELLGLGTFYYELAVQLVELCYLTRPSNGGLLSLADATHSLQQRRTRALRFSSSSTSSTSSTSSPSTSSSTSTKLNASMITGDDVERAVQVLRELGNGFAMVRLGAVKMIRSVPTELDVDQEAVLGLAQGRGFVSTQGVLDALGWSRERAAKVLHQLLVAGFAWIDRADGAVSYWFPCFVFLE